VEVDAAQYAEFLAYQSGEAAREQERVAAQWAAWAGQVGGEPWKIGRAHDLAVALMADHSVSAWTLKFGNALRKDGSVHYLHRPGSRMWDGKPGTLTLSGPLMSLWTAEQQRETILHEIAHIMCPDNGHDAVWGYHCARLGIEPRTCWDESRMASAPPVKQRVRPWVGTCKGGHAHKPRARKPTARYSCAACSPGRFDPGALVTWALRSP
jgi:hypothetical protein